MAGDFGPTWQEVEGERNPHELEMEFEAYGLLSDLQAELRQMRREMSPEYERAEQWREAVKYLVDAGLIQRVVAVSNRDAVQLALLEIGGERAQWPIDVYDQVGGKTTFVRAENSPEAPPPKKAPAKAASRAGWKWLFQRRRTATPKTVPLLEWAAWFEHFKKRIVRQVRIKHRGRWYFVSTVFLGLDHNFGGGVPILWETMISRETPEPRCWLDYQERYASFESALNGHSEAVRFVVEHDCREAA
jgi:hypothetical protein